MANDTINYAEIGIDQVRRALGFRESDLDVIGRTMRLQEDPRVKTVTPIAGGTISNFQMYDITTYEVCSEETLTDLLVSRGLPKPKAALPNNEPGAYIFSIFPEAEDVTGSGKGFELRFKSQETIE